MAEPMNMYVPPPCTPLGQKAGVGMVDKTSSTVMSPEEMEMETEAQQSCAVPP